MVQVTRNLIALVFWLVVAGCALGVMVMLVMANYVASKAAFELMGFEARPLKTDELVGTLFGAFFPDATLAHLYALGMTAAVALSFFVLFHVISHAYGLLLDRSGYVANGDAKRAKVATQILIADVLVLLGLGGLLVPACRWDLELFRFRTVAGAMGMDDPAKATTLKNWSVQLRDHGDLFVWALTHHGAWGYLAVTILACLVLEFAFGQLDDRWARLLMGIGTMFKSREIEEAEPPIAVDESRDENFVPDAESGSVTGGPERESNPLFPGPVGSGSERGHPADGPEGGPEPGPAPSYRTEKGPSARQVPSQKPAEPVKPSARAASGRVDADLRDVVGSEGERVPLAEARANQSRYHIEPDGQVWSREYWERLHGVMSENESEAA